MQARAVHELSARGDLARAGALAVTARDWEALDRVALELVRTTISVLPIDTAGRWLERVPPEHRTMPGLRLLSAALSTSLATTGTPRSTASSTPPPTRAARGDARAEVVALSLGTVAAQSRCDVPRLLALASRSAAVPGALDDPIVRLADGTISAVVAEMSGNPEAALDAFAETPLADVPRGWRCWPTGSSCTACCSAGEPTRPWRSPTASWRPVRTSTWSRCRCSRGGWPATRAHSSTRTVSTATSTRRAAPARATCSSHPRSKP